MTQVARSVASEVSPLGHRRDAWRAVTRREYLDVFSSAFGLGRLRPTPAWLVRIVADGAASALVASQRCANGRFRSETGWAPSYPSVREGWPAVAAARGAGVSAR